MATEVKRTPFVLLEFDERRRGENLPPDDSRNEYKGKLDEFLRWLEHEARWPAGTALGVHHEIKRVYPERGMHPERGKHTPKFNVYVEATGATTPELMKRVCEMIEAHCHVEGYAG